jgi:uncharacterized membrane protein YdbT with pleckstrin-like domain
MDLHPGEEIVFEGHPSWRGVLTFYIKGLAVALVIGVIVFFAVSDLAGILVFVAILAVVVLVGYVKRMATDYAITTERLHIRRGILSKNIQQTNIDRVQNVNTSQSILERLLRVGDVDFDTAGTDDSEFAFSGVANPSGVVAAVDRAQRARRDAGPTTGL